MIYFIFKQIICFLDFIKGIGMGNEWFCIDFSFSNQSQCFLTVTTIHTACFECKIFPIHIRKRQTLRFIIECYNSYNGIWSRTFPGKTECRFSSSNFQHHICTSMITVFMYKSKHSSGATVKTFG